MAAGVAVRKRRRAESERRLSKGLSLLIMAAMVLHLIKPIGLPGLRHRKDFWKLALGAIVAMMVTVLISHGA